MFSGPFVGGLLNRFGCRPVCFAGGCITSLGFIFSSVVGDIVPFLLTFGVLGGNYFAQKHTNKYNMTVLNVKGSN